MPYTLVPIVFEFDQIQGRILWKGIQIAPSTGGSGKALVSDPGAFTVPAFVSIGDLVRSTGAFTATRADASSAAGMPGIGIVTAKPTPTTATVAYEGEIGGGVGLVPGTVYYAGLLGALVTTPAYAPGYVIQEVCIALSPTSMKLSPVLNPVYL